MKHYIRFPRAEGTHSRQAHANLPQDTYEREMGKEGFFGPAVHFHHRHPPTGWTRFAGALNPHAYDLNKLRAAGASPWEATPVMGNGDVKLRLWKTATPMDHLVRTAELTGHPLDDATLAKLGKLVQKQVSPMRTTVTASNYRRQVAAVLAQRLVRELAG